MMDALDDNILSQVLAYLPHQFRYVALVDRRFRRLYPYSYAAVTTFHNAMESAATTKIWLAENTYLVEAQGCKFAVRYGKLPALKFLVSQGCYLSNSAYIEAAKYGNLHILQWLRSENHPCVWDRSVIRAAIKKGHLNIVQWICHQGDPVVKYGFGCDDVETAVDDDDDFLAAIQGHLHILQWRQQQYPDAAWTHLAVIVAAGFGHVGVLRWLSSHVPPDFWTSPVTRLAALNGRTEALQYLRSRDPPCPWTAFACNDAARSGHLSTLQWMRSQDPPCPWNRTEVLEAATTGRQQHVLDWMQGTQDGREA